MKVDKNPAPNFDKWLTLTRKLISIGLTILRIITSNVPSILAFVSIYTSYKATKSGNITICNCDSIIDVRPVSNVAFFMHRI